MIDPFSFSFDVVFTKSFSIFLLFFTSIAALFIFSNVIFMRDDCSSEFTCLLYVVLAVFTSLSLGVSLNYFFYDPKHKLPYVFDFLLENNGFSSKYVALDFKCFSFTSVCLALFIKTLQSAKQIFLLELGPWEEVVGRWSGEVWRPIISASWRVASKSEMISLLFIIGAWW